MKSTTAAVYNTITSDYHNTVGTILHAEWNLNRYYRTVVDNTPAEDTDGYDIEFFPIESITKPNRPQKSGICKAVVGQALVAQNFYTEVPSARYYTVDADDEYKYWQSPLSAVAGTFAMTNCAPQVLYVEDNNVADLPVPKVIKANKIAFVIENTFAEPVDYDVQIKTSTGGAWTTVASDIAVPDSGLVELWHNGGSWTTSKALYGDYSNLTNVHAVRIVVNTMSAAAYFNLIELGFRIESNISSDVESWSDNFNMGEVDFVTPLGTISSNTGSINLFHEDERYKNSTLDSPYYNLLDKGVKFTCWMKYGNDLVQEFEMFSDTWDESIDNTSVSLVDASRFFMETRPRAVLYRGISVQEAAWRICDIVGFNNYEVNPVDANDTTIDIFWCDGEKSAWEILSELARGTQTAIYFDSYGVLQVKTRNVAWDNSQSPVYDFTRDTVPGGNPANIASLDAKTNYEANKITVNYRPTGFSEKRDNIIPFETVWEPDGNVVLRSTPIAAAMTIDQLTVNLGAAGKTWPFKGMMQIEGEWISYDGKWYNYYTEAGTRTGKWVYTLEEQQKLDEDAGSFYRHMNAYSGNLKITERGLWNTQATAHNMTLISNNWATYRQRNYGTSVANKSGFILSPGKSSLTISAPKVNSDFYHYMVRGSYLDAPYGYLGTRLKIDKTSHAYKGGGIFFNAGSSLGTGYFVEVMATSRMTGTMRKNRNEIVLYSMKSDGSKKIIGGEEIVMKDKSRNHKRGATIKKDIGAKFAVPANSYIDIDIYYTTSGSDHIVRIFANGRQVIAETIPAAWRQAGSGRFGLFARGHSSVTFDYVYGIYNNSTSVPEVEPFYDRIDSSWVSDQWKRDWTYETRTVRRKIRGKWTKVKQRYNQRFYDEFGPVAHEIREFDIKFTTELPVLESKLYMSNTTQALATDYAGDISGAKFTLANFHRANAVVNGDDTLTAGGNTINHKLLVYGRPVIQKDAQKIERTDDWALRRRGPIEVEYNSNWIQNKAAAESLANWLATHWTRSDADVDAEVFGNPLIELTDVVNIDHNDIQGPFYVTSIANSWNNGLNTNLGLRKVT